jgi:hypothetical protein
MFEHPARLVRVSNGVLISLALSVLMAVLGWVSVASAGEHDLQGRFAVFSDCPLENPSTWKCFVDETSSGVFTLGKRTIPVTTMITVRGGMTEPNKREEGMIAAEDGNTLSKAALTVPGGLLGLIAPSSLPQALRTTFDENVEKGLTTVTATVELADPRSPGTISEYNLLSEEGIALGMALRVKLSNPFLGNACFIGTSANPILLSMTTGSTRPPSPNKPIAGLSGTASLLEGAEIAVLGGDSIVDNEFAAPAASGCGGASSALIDTAIDTQLGLPSPAGQNTAILNGRLMLATAAAVKAHE